MPVGRKARSSSAPPTERWRQLSIEASPGLIGIHDLDGTILYVNPAAADALGYEQAALVGRNYAELVAPSLAPYFAPAIERLRTEGRGEGLVMMVTKDGAQRRWWYRHTLHTEPGQPPVVVGDSTDITDIHNPSEALQESEQRFRYLAENIHQVFWLRDPRTSEILYLSPAFESVWGRSRAAMIEQPWSFVETVHADDRRLLLENFVMSAGGETTRMEYRIVRPDGTERWIASHAFPVRDAHGHVTRVVAITEDVSERHQVEDELRRARDAAEAATREKSLLLAHVSHEVRNPLQVIFGLIEFVLDSPLEVEQRNELKRVLVAAETLNTLANDLLDFAKIEASHTALRCAMVDVRDVLNLAMAAFVAKPRPGIVFTGEVADEVPRQLIGDGDRLRQVLANLIGNASKFTETGSVHTRIEVSDEDAAGVMLQCTVRDTGQGIAPDDQQSIFEPFSQAHTATTRDQRGVGLGLAICAQLVKAMGGRIWVKSTVGHGSTFGFTARLARPSH